MASIFAAPRGNHLVDRAIKTAYAQLADRRVRDTFSELLVRSRVRAPALFAAPIADGRHPGVDALVNLARLADVHQRPITAWPGSSGSWRVAVHELASHLVGRYPVPRFLGASWYADDAAYGDAKRRWFVAHAGGAPFRTLLPGRFTRHMEHVFLRSPDHLGIEQAVHRAELLVLGAEPALITAVLATRAALDLEHGDFWRSAWRFLIANARVITLPQVGPVVDFLHAIRHEPRAVETADGVVMREPTQPAFSLTGRTARSVMRLMEGWHRSLGLSQGGLSWPRSRERSLLIEVPGATADEPAAVWELVELTNSAQLQAEGRALRHCVASYGHACWRGDVRIWSLRRRCESGVKSIATVEVSPRTRTIVQARGFLNRPLTRRAWQLVQSWARREGLRLSI